MANSSSDTLSFIIGGSSGMGLATALLLVVDGGKVVLVARDEEKSKARKEELEAGGKGKVETISTDLYDPASVKGLIARIDRETRHMARR